MRGGKREGAGAKPVIAGRIKVALIEGASTVRRLASALNVSEPSIYKALRTLEAAGVVGRTLRPAEKCGRPAWEWTLRA